MPPKPKGLQSAWYNALDAESLLGALQEVIAQNGWTVASGKKPLPGAVTWKEDGRHGTHYAAGPRADFERAWAAGGAVVLTPITNEKILEEVSSFIIGRGLVMKGEKVAHAIERLGGIAQLAAHRGLPWFDTATLELETVALQDRVEQVVERETEAARAAMVRGEAAPLQISFDVPAMSEAALRLVVDHFKGLGWNVQVEAPGGRTRRWAMSRI